MNENPLISIIIVSYNNYKYIYNAIDSVLFQDYPNIELIISNDASPDFDKITIEKYLKKNSKKNIKNIIINNNKKNLGTVKNVNIALKLSKGDYILLFAADDVIYKKDIVSKFIKSFKSLPEKELIITSQVGMYDQNLKKLIQLFISKQHQKLIKKLKPQKLFAEMATKCMCPGCGTCYKKEIFKKYGYFDEKYVLVEDYSSALKFSRLGIKYNYFDFISFKHRDGGISHGNIDGESKKSKQYELDIINILKNEVKPHLKYLNKKQLSLFNKKLRSQILDYKYNYKYKNKALRQKLLFIKENFRGLLEKHIGEFGRDVRDQFIGKKAKILFLGLTLIISSLFLSKYKISTIINLSGIIVSIFGFSLILIYIFKKYLSKIIRFLR